MLMTHAPETGARNWRQKTGVGFWRRFFTPVAKFLAPETNTDEQKSNQTFYLAIRPTHVK